MSTLSDDMAVALFRIEQMAQNHILTPEGDTVHKIASCAREALQSVPKTLAKALDTYRNGDYLSDDELKALNGAMDQMADLASKLGPVFHLAGAYAAHVQYSTKQMMNARGINDDRPKTQAHKRVG